ncbi:Na+/H+ antiporter subunit E [Terricaulis sp.]|uniref:Na+/H+ antiporter subunit E n=1 Tax=Terricaulis sp. TaxID=2768686 RepID=UPI003782D8FC
MLHAAAMLVGLFVLWLLSVQAWSTPEDFAVAAGAALACTLVALRFAGGGHAFARGPQFALLIAGRARNVIAGALSAVRAALAADVTLRPALVRVKTSANGAFARAALADMISATPGSMVVDSDSESLLVHVIDEDAVDAESLGRLETRVLAALGERA